ncbi:MAG: response regulator [Gammaproteobacteria bacterium]|nr:response regulator [Gammaproteobacteria bacterium]MDH5728920.1 response regulator [Gammaproteobacteria bacterium]
MDQAVTARPIHILLVEDNTADIRLTQEALKDAKVFNHLSIVQDGEQALDFLFKRGQYTQVSTPDLILLDLNLPRIDGREVLQEIKRQDKLLRIPVVVLTTSGADEDILRSYNLHANCYVTKPVEFDQFMQIIHSIESFWLSIVKLPPEDDAN